jgi:phosphoglycerate dehydrogenase-like enzyme
MTEIAPRASNTGVETRAVSGSAETESASARVTDVTQRKTVARRSDLASVTLTLARRTRVLANARRGNR